MKGRIAVAALSLLIAQPIFADFSALAGAVERHLGVTRTWMPFLGMARVFVRAAHPKGVHDFQLALFEGGRGSGGETIEQILRRAVGPGFSPIVRVHSSRRDEWSFIYAKPGNNGVIELMIVNHEPTETVVVRVTADAGKVMNELNKPGGVAGIGRD
ncbi:MAG: hypothetical protein JJE51_08075 [Thermoanaerobaculia bacterium]|nr:hypothetical protein [Thermoanaerobaculia bacterium]